MADHPRHEDLAALVFGDLSDDEAGQVAQHVEHCPRCDETVRELETAPNDVIRLLRRPVVEHPFERESHCRRLVEVVEAIGRDPYADAKYDTVLKKLAAMATQPVPAIQERRAEVPDALAAIIERMLAKEPDDRFAAPRELAEKRAPAWSSSRSRPGAPKNTSPPRRPKPEPPGPKFRRFGAGLPQFGAGLLTPLCLLRGKFSSFSIPCGLLIHSAAPGCE